MVMNSHNEHLETLSEIRNLMERATLYRAISAPTAIFGGGLAAAVSLILILKSPGLPPDCVYVLWIGVLGLVAIFNTILLWRDARKRGDALMTPGLKHALRSLTPPMFVGGVVGFFAVDHSLPLMTGCWVLFYGLALLATHGFAPASLKVLGVVFVASGLAVFTFTWMELLWIDADPARQLLASSLVMGLTFGLFHLVYGLAIGVTTRFRISKRPKPEGRA